MAAASPAGAVAAPAPLTSPADAGPVQTSPHGSGASSGPAPQLWLPWGDSIARDPLPSQDQRWAQRGLLPGCSAMPFLGECLSTWGAPPPPGLAAPSAGSRAVSSLDHAVPCCRLARPALCLDTGSSPDNTLPRTVNILPKSGAHPCLSTLPCRAGHREGAAARPPQRLVAPKVVPFPMHGACCSFGAHRGPLAPGRGEGVLGVEWGTGCGAGDGGRAGVFG